LIEADRTKSRILLLGAVFCVAVAGATARWAGRDDARSPRGQPETRAAEWTATSAEDGRAGPDRRASTRSPRVERSADSDPRARGDGRPQPQQGQPPHPEGISGGPSLAAERAPGEARHAQPLTDLVDSPAGIRSGTARSLERSAPEAHEITLRDIDWFGEHVVRPREGEASAQPETRGEGQRADERNRAEELAEACAEGDGAACAGRLEASASADRIYLPRVVDDSLAYAVGLRAGDEIVRVGGEPIASVFDVRDALASRSQGPPILIEALRDGVPMQFSVPAGTALGVPIGSRKARPPPR